MSLNWSHSIQTLSKPGGAQDVAAMLAAFAAHAVAVVVIAQT